MNFDLSSIFVNVFIISFPNIFKSLWLMWLFILFLIIRMIYYYIKLNKAGMFEIDRMTGSEFENYLSIFFKKLGYEVKQVGSSKGDYGADLIITKDNIVTAIQAKRHTSLIGIDAVREVLGSLKYYNCNEGIVITNNYFTKQAKFLAKVNNIKLWDRKVLIQKINDLSSK